MQVTRDPQGSASQESFARAMELTKAYAGSGSVTHFSAVARLFYDLFEMFETGADPRIKQALFILPTLVIIAFLVSLGPFEN